MFQKGSTPWNKLSAEEKKSRSRDRDKARYPMRKEAQKIRLAKRWLENREKELIRLRLLYRSNKKHHLEVCKTYRAANREKMNAAKLAWQKNQLKTNPSYQVARNVRERIRFALFAAGGIKCAKSMDLLGCSVEYLRGYLEAAFESGMTWENYGTWHIDHIIPCASFDLTNIEAQKECFHYSNLQPLWAEDNLSKGASVPNTRNNKPCLL